MTVQLQRTLERKLHLVDKGLFSTVKIRTTIGVERDDISVGGIHMHIMLEEESQNLYWWPSLVHICGSETRTGLLLLGDLWQMWKLSSSIWDDSEVMAAKKCMLQELAILECNRWICKKINLFRAVLSDLFQFLKINHEDTRNIECGIKATLILDVTFFHSVLVYKTHIIGS